MPFVVIVDPETASISNEASDTTVADTTAETSSENGEHEHSHAAISDFIPEFDAAKEAFGVDEVQGSVIALGWVDNIYLINAGAPVAAMPDNHHIPEEILSAHKMLTDHDGNVDLELIRELSPAVIFANSRAIENVEGLAALIEEIGAKVLEIPTASTYEDVLKNIGLLSALFGTQEAAAENIHTLLHRIMDAASLVDEESAKKVAIITITADGEFIMRDNAFQNDLLSLVGAENIASAIEFEGEPDQSGNFTSPGIATLKEAGAEAFVIMVRIKGDNDAKDAAIAKITEEIRTSFGEDSTVVKNQRYDVIDHHGFIISFPGAISGLENLADIISR